VLIIIGLGCLALLDAMLMLSCATGSENVPMIIFLITPSEHLLCHSFQLVMSSQDV